VTVTAACGSQTATVTVAASGGALTVNSAAQTNVSCNGGCNGSATVSVSGGTAPYTYSWSPSGGNAATASALCAGTYTCTVTDANGCIGTHIFTITQPPALVVTPTQVNVSCNGGCNGTATATVSGGTPAYTYAWTPSGGTGATASGLCAGTYTCTIHDANGCLITQTYTITQPVVLTATQSQVNVTCNGGCNGSATVTASGGTPAYTYAWAPSGGNAATASSLCAGTYTCTITDSHGCVITKIFTITQPPALTVTGTQVNVSCNGGCNGSATVTAGGGTPAYTYAWTPSGGNAATASSLCAGTYTCTITDSHGCVITKIFTITQPAALTATSTMTPATCGGSNGTATATPAGGSPAYTYSWNPTGQTTATASGLPAGSYTCTVTDSHGCTTTTIITVTTTGGITASISASTNVSCNGGCNGSATVTPAGGTAPYTYSW